MNFFKSKKEILRGEKEIGGWDEKFSKEYP
jgi:hypothetical protein